MHGPAGPVARASALARRGVLAVWLACVALALGIAWRTHYVADLSAFLPSTPSAEQAVLLDQLRSGVASRLVLIGLEGGTREARSAASVKLAQALRQSGAFDAVHNGDNSQFEGTARFLFEHRYLLSPAVDAQRFTVEGLRAGIDESTSLLGTPAGALIKPVILRDPTGETVRMAEGMLPAQSPRMDGGVWVSRDGHRAVLLATTHADGADLDGQERALQLVHSRFDALKAEGVTLVLSGSGSFAVASRAQIKHEVERLAIAGGVAIIGILLLSFGGSLRTLASAMLPVACGVLGGIAAVSLVFGNVHGITLGFGTTLIGEAVDYAIYYLIQARPLSGSAKGTGAKQWVVDNWPTVRLGLWTSICGFAALLFSGFPGLAQLGVFSIAGLAAAALTTRHVFPLIAPDGAPGIGLRRRLGQAVGWCSAVLPRARWPLAAVVVVAAVALVVMPSGWRGNLSSLSPVGADKLKLDETLRGDIGASDNGTIVAVAAADEAGVLAQAEAAGARLDKLVDAGVIAGYESPARVLPSPATQERRRAALPDAAVLSANLEQATVDGPLPARRLQAFIADVQAARQQPPLTLASFKGTPLAPALAAQVLAGDGTRPWRALLRVQPGPKGEPDVARLRTALADLPGTQVVNIGNELSGLYARYLREARLQALLGAVAVCVLLGVHLRSWRRLWRIAQPIAGAVLIVLAAMTAAGVPLGILHLVGLLLTVAIGSNYALFFDQIRAMEESQPPGTPYVVDSDTLASLALANLTAVVSFCLLAFSSIPALYAVGEVVAPGILLGLLLSAAFIPARKP
ncbi:MAG: MMPL family transporter [Rhizobacter sp.]|nr:MMPL family transporter [Rhizobacter sp.]